LLFPSFAYTLIAIQSLFQQLPSNLLGVGVLFLALIPVNSFLRTAQVAEKRFYGYQLLAGGTFLLLVFMHLPLHISHVLGSIVLYHYFVWYIYYVHRLKGKGNALSQYVKDMMVINGSVMAVFALLFVLGGRTPLFSLLFNVIFGA